MSTAYITEYAGLRITTSSPTQVPATPAITTQTVSYTTSTQSAAFNSSTTLIEFTSPTACHVLFGSNPTATTSTTLVPANVTRFWGVKSGDKIAVVAAA